MPAARELVLAAAAFAGHRGRTFLSKIVASYVEVTDVENICWQRPQKKINMSCV